MQSLLEEEEQEEEEEEERVDHVFPLLTFLCGMYTPGSV